MKLTRSILFLLGLIMVLMLARGVRAMTCPRDDGDDECTHCAPDDSAMARFFVSEPEIDLNIVDSPLWYIPARGNRIDFRLHYQQRDAVAEDNTVFGPGTNWSCSFRAFMAMAGSTPVLHRGGEDYVQYVSVGGDVSRDFRNGSICTALYAGFDLVGFSVVYQDGAQAIFNTAWGTNFFLTTYADPNGHTNTCSYTNSSGTLRLTRVTDADGLATQLAYGSTSFPNLITSVTDPFGRTCSLQYDESAGSASYRRLTNITDVIGITSGFKYDAATSWITNMTTPYGSTGFKHGGVDKDVSPASFQTTNVVNRYVLISEPNGGKQLYLYRQNCSAIMSATRSVVPDPQGLTNTFDNVDQDQRNSFHWGRLQYSASERFRPTTTRQS